MYQLLCDVKLLLSGLDVRDILFYEIYSVLFAIYTYIYVCIYTGLFKMIVRVLTTCHTQYTSDSSICVFLFNRTTLQVFVTYRTGALYVHPL